MANDAFNAKPSAPTAGAKDQSSLKQKPGAPASSPSSSTSSKDSSMKSGKDKGSCGC